MTAKMKRRTFITLLGGAVAWPLAARAQQARNQPTIGFLDVSKGSGWSNYFDAFVQRLHELGWIERKSIVIERRWAARKLHPECVYVFHRRGRRIASFRRSYSICTSSTRSPRNSPATRLRRPSRISPITILSIRIPA